MQRRLITVILFAVVAAFASSSILYRIISAKSAHASDSSMPQVYVASRDLSAGSLIGESDVRQVRWAGAVNPQWVSHREDLVGRGLSVAINSGEPFPDNRLAAKGGGVGFASNIPQGMRVVPVHVDGQSGLSRLIVAGSHVDVLSTVAAGGLSATRTILQNVRVLSTDQSADKNTKDKSAAVESVSLLVTPQQAEVLSEAIAQNRIQLVLRNPLDESSIAQLLPQEIKPAAPVVRKPREVTVTEKKIEAPVVQKPAPPTVEMVSGTKKTTTVVAPSASQEVTQ
jgi:Flp pilus assembly protein CpaB